VNPVPSNIKGGISSLEEKSLGAIHKAGTAPIQGVLRYAERPGRKGLFFVDNWMGHLSIFAGYVAAGANIVLFQLGGGGVAGRTLLEGSPSVVAPFLWALADLRRSPPDVRGSRFRRLAGLALATGVPMAALLVPPLLAHPEALAGKAGFGGPGRDTLAGVWYAWLGTPSAIAVVLCSALAAFGARDVWRALPVVRTGVLGIVLTLLAVSLTGPEWIHVPLTLARYLLPFVPLLLVAAAAGAVLLIDYGFPAAEYYHPQRNAGTLMCHYRHRSHGDPFAWPGLTDITAHVDFSAMAQAGVRAGLTVAGFAAQAPFLMGCGLLDALAAAGAPESPAYIRAAAAVQKLLSPAEMGELFKVLALARSPGIAWPGYALANRDHAL